MKQLDIPFTALVNDRTAIEQISNMLDSQLKNDINIVSWPAFDYQPEVTFAVAHTNDNLLLKFFVKENSIRALHRQINDPVYKDSCVEFFIALNGEEKYYNFEFNCAGTCKAGYGADRNAREVLPEMLLKTIKTMPVIKLPGSGKDQIQWQLTLKVPKTVFCKHEIQQFKGMTSKMNFFKCGDNLPTPHYLSWNKIKADKPNFHIPACFGQITFA